MTEIQEFIPYTRQVLDEEDIKAVTKALKSPLITRGPLVKDFEEAICNYTGAKYAVAFNSGSTAFMGAYLAAEISPHDKIYTSPISFIGTISGALLLGATPVFLDVDPQTAHIDISLLDQFISHQQSRGKNIFVPVHYAGNAMDMESFTNTVSGIHSLVIEDACQALGARYPDGNQVGSCSYSDMTVFSFHPAKTICTGEGGMVTTNNPNLYEKLLLARNNGIAKDPNRLDDAPWHYQVMQASNNFNYTEFQAAMGLSQLKKIDTFIEKRRTIAKWYHKRFARMNLLTLPPIEEDRCAYNLYYIQAAFQKNSPNKKKTMDYLQQQGIGSQVHFIPLYHHPILEKKYGFLAEYFPGAEQFYKKSLSLPMYTDLLEEQVARVCYSLKQALKLKAS